MRKKNVLWMLISFQERASYLVDVLLCFLYYDVTIIIIGGIFRGGELLGGVTMYTYIELAS